MGKLVKLTVMVFVITYGWHFYKQQQMPSGNQETPSSQQSSSATSTQQEAASTDNKNWFFSGKKTSNKQEETQTQSSTQKYAPSQDESNYYITERDMEYLMNYFKKPNPPAYITVPSGLQIHMKTIRKVYCPRKKKHFPIRRPSKNFVVVPERPQ